MHEGLLLSVLMRASLRSILSAGSLHCSTIHQSEAPSLPYGVTLMQTCPGPSRCTCRRSCALQGIRHSQRPRHPVSRPPAHHIHSFLYD